MRIALVALLVVGCTSAPIDATPEQSAAVVTPQVIYVTPDPTSEPTAQPTVAPTERPTPTRQPTPEPTIPPVTGMGALAFMLEFTDYLETMMPLIEQLGEDMQNDNADDRASTTIAAMNTAVSSFRAWLNRNPPEPCLAEPHALMLRALERTSDGLGDGFTRGTVAYGLVEPITWNDVLEGMTTVNEGTEMMTRAGDMLTTACQ